MFIENNWVKIGNDQYRLDMICWNSYLYKKYEIDKETIEYVMDKKRTCPYGIIIEKRYDHIYLQCIDLEKDKEYYETIPMTFIVQDTRPWPSVTRTMLYHWNKMVRYLESQGSCRSISCFLQVLKWRNAYYPIIDRLDKHKDELNRLLPKDNDDQESLCPVWPLRPVWCIWSQQPSKIDVKLEHIKAHAIYRGMNDVEKEQFDDAMIEARQLVSMTELISNVFATVDRDLDNNILNTNLNDNLTTLTIFEALWGF